MSAVSYFVRKYIVKNQLLMFMTSFTIIMKYKVQIKESEQLLVNKKRRLGKKKHEVLSQVLSKNKEQRILELGAGVGVIGAYLQRLGVRFFGIEIDHQTVKRAEMAGLNIVQGDFKSAKNSEQKFDSTLVFEVIEHLQELDELFSMVNEKLHINGY